MVAGKKSFNQKVERLQNIISKLETGELELEEVDKLVTEGLILLKDTRLQLTGLESKITKIFKNKNAGD